MFRAEKLVPLQKKNKYPAQPFIYAVLGICFSFDLPIFLRLATISQLIFISFL